MLQDLNWQTTDHLTRAQLAIFRSLGEAISLTEDDQRRALDLDDRTWRAWTRFLSNGPIPTEPPLPEMLMRLGETAFYLSIVAEVCSSRPRYEL